MNLQREIKKVIWLDLFVVLAIAIAIELATHVLNK